MDTYRGSVCVHPAKHTLQIEGQGNSSLKHAIEQVSNVKRLCNTREKVDYLQLKTYFNLKGILNVTPVPGFPDKLNPCFTAIFARQVRQKEGVSVLNEASKINSLLSGIEFPLDASPDFMIAGAHNLMLSAIWHEASRKLEFASPFFIPGLKRPIVVEATDIAFGVGLCVLLCS